MFKKSNVGDQLLIAVKLNKISEISRLVALGVDVDSRIDKNGKTALQYAAYKGQLLAVKALIEAGADLDLTDENGVTALHRAIIHGHTDVVCTLLAAGCSVDTIDENGNSALHEAAWNGYSKCVELLVAAKCSINMHNRTGYTSLHLAAQNCHCTTVKVLLDGGSNPLAKNNYGDTPLHLAVRYGHVEVCNILMETKINVSEQNNDGNTPLHIAASMGHEKLTEMLLEAGSDATEKNNVGDTARDLAVRNRFKKIARLLAPSRGDTLRMFRRKERGEKPRPYSADVSNFFSGTTDSTLTTNATHLWIPKPVSLDPDSKKQDHKRDFSSHLPWGRKRKDERKPKVLTIKYEEMCSIERNYIKKRNETRKSHKNHSKSSLKSQEERVRSDPVLHQKQRKFHSLVKVDEKMKSAQSRDDLEVTLTPKKNKKDKGLFALFRSASDTELNADEQKNGLLGKKHKDKYPLPGEAMGNGVHHVSKEVREKGDIEETKEKKEKRKSEEKTEKKDRTGKKSREEEKEKKERRKEKEKEKKQSRRDGKDGSESDCSICQEKRRKSREKAHSKESKHKEPRGKSEHRRTKDHKDGELKDKYEKTHVDKKDEDKEHKKKKHHRDREKEKEHKEREKEHRDKEREKEHKEREKDRSRRDKNHKRKTEEHGEDFAPMPCNQTHCSTCQAQLRRLEAWQERCTSEIDSARRRLEHRLQRLEKKLEEQLSEERQSKEKETREYDRVVDRVTDECREVSKNVKDSSGNVKEEIRGLIKGGLSKLELKLGQISAGYNIPFMENQARCNPELGKNCSAERRIRHVRSRSSPHLGRAPCEDCLHVMEHRAGGASPHLASFSGSGTSSRATSGIRVSDSGSLDTVIEARPVGDKGLYASGTIIEARPVDDEGLDTVIEAQHVVEDETVKINETYAATQVQHQKQIQEVEKWWRAKAEEEQRVLYARICELEQMLMMSRPGGDCFV